MVSPTCKNALVSNVYNTYSRIKRRFKISKLTPAEGAGVRSHLISVQKPVRYVIRQQRKQPIADPQHGNKRGKNNLENELARYLHRDSDVCPVSNPRTGGMTYRQMQSGEDSTVKSPACCETEASRIKRRKLNSKKVFGLANPVAEGWPLDYKTRPVFETLIAFNSDGVENVIPSRVPVIRALSLRTICIIALLAVAIIKSDSLMSQFKAVLKGVIVGGGG